eukprot:6212646-Pleurochrysis_carterae.AAC.4
MEACEGAQERAHVFGRGRGRSSLNAGQRALCKGGASTRARGRGSVRAVRGSAGAWVRGCVGAWHREHLVRDAKHRVTRCRDQRSAVPARARERERLTQAQKRRGNPFGAKTRAREEAGIRPAIRRGGNPRAGHFGEEFSRTWARESLHAQK